MISSSGSAFLRIILITAMLPIAYVIIPLATFNLTGESYHDDWSILELQDTGVFSIIKYASATSSITATTDKTTYNPGDTLVVSGSATAHSPIMVKVYNPSDIIVGIRQGNAESDDEYSIEILTWPIEQVIDMPFGIYRIQVTDMEREDNTEITVGFTGEGVATFITVTETSTTDMTEPMIYAWAIGATVTVVILALVLIFRKGGG